MRCVQETPDLVPQLGDPAEHLAACHFPVQDGEDISKSRPTISEDLRIVETGLVAEAAGTADLEGSNRGI